MTVGHKQNIYDYPKSIKASGEKPKDLMKPDGTIPINGISQPLMLICPSLSYKKNTYVFGPPKPPSGYQVPPTVKHPPRTWAELWEADQEKYWQQTGPSRQEFLEGELSIWNK